MDQKPEGEGVLYGEPEALFRLLWRMDHNRPGKPEYPELTWGLLGEYLEGHPGLMDHIGSRRHRLNFDEAPHVHQLVHGRLQQLLMDHSEEVRP